MLCPAPLRGPGTHPGRGPRPGASAGAFLPWGCRVNLAARFRCSCVRTGLQRRRARSGGLPPLEDSSPGGRASGAKGPGLRPLTGTRCMPVHTHFLTSTSDLPGRKAEFPVPPVPAPRALTWPRHHLKFCHSRLRVVCFSRQSAGSGRAEHVPPAPRAVPDASQALGAQRSLAERMDERNTDLHVVPPSVPSEGRAVCLSSLRSDNTLGTAPTSFPPSPAPAPTDDFDRCSNYQSQSHRILAVRPWLAGLLRSAW